MSEKEEEEEKPLAPSEIVKEMVRTFVLCKDYIALAKHFGTLWSVFIRMRFAMIS